MASHSCNHCGTLVLTNNRICHKCGRAVKNARKLPVFWFVFTASLFVTYAALDFMSLI